MAATRFSIVTPSFRQAEWLRLCAASVADQEGVVQEHLVQDAGTGNDLEQWAAGRPGLRLVVEPDAGMYDALNRGLRRASGEVLAWLNCDEQYLPGTLRQVGGFFARNPEVDVLFGDALLVDASGAPLSYRRAVLPGRVHTRLGHLGTMSCAMFFRRWIVDEGILFDPAWKAAGDAVWMDRLFARKARLGRLAQPLATFTFTGENLGATNLSQREAQKWATQPGAPPSWLRVPSMIAHRARKAWAGAYRRRRVDYAIFTRESPEQRVYFHRDGVGFSWPREVLLH